MRCVSRLPAHVFTLSYSSIQHLSLNTHTGNSVILRPLGVPRSFESNYNVSVAHARLNNRSRTIGINTSGTQEDESRKVRSDPSTVPIPLIKVCLRVRKLRGQRFTNRRRKGHTILILFSV